MSTSAKGQPFSARKGNKKQMDVVGHNNGGGKMDPWCGAGAPAREWPKAALPQTVFKHKIASAIRQDQARTSAESNEQRRIGVL
jgi:hypothetical protein